MKFQIAGLALTLGLVSGACASQAATCDEWRWLVAQAGASFERVPLTRADDYVYDSGWAPGGWTGCQVVDSDDGGPTFGCSRQASGLPANEARAVIREIIACVPGSAHQGWDNTWGDEITFPNGASLSINTTSRQGFVNILLTATR